MLHDDFVISGPIRLLLNQRLICRVSPSLDMGFLLCTGSERQ